MSSMSSSEEYVHAAPSISISLNLLLEQEVIHLQFVSPSNFIPSWHEEELISYSLPQWMIMQQKLLSEVDASGVNGGDRRASALATSSSGGSKGVEHHQQQQQPASTTTTSSSSGRRRSNLQKSNSDKTRTFFFQAVEASLLKLQLFLTKLQLFTNKIIYSCLMDDKEHVNFLSKKLGMLCKWDRGLHPNLEAFHMTRSPYLPLHKSFINGLGTQVVLISVAILFMLFSFQRFGTDKVGYTFAPVISMWFLLIAGIGMYNLVVQDIGVLRAFNPMYIVQYFIRNGKSGWVSLSGIILCVTGFFSSASTTSCPVSGTVLYWAGALPEEIPRQRCKHLLQIHPSTNVLANHHPCHSCCHHSKPSYALRCVCHPLQGPVSWLHAKGSSDPHLAQVRGAGYIPEVNLLMGFASIVVTVAFRTTTSISHAYGNYTPVTLLGEKEKIGVVSTVRRPNMRRAEDECRREHAATEGILRCSGQRLFHDIQVMNQMEKSESK
ncbi:hypothetical protein ZWY2020_014783 [Hordeum vulgare]|nr:hypothetical protein ZWY2020_014783 [Hordeum vulgare]